MNKSVKWAEIRTFRGSGSDGKEATSLFLNVTFLAAETTVVRQTDLLPAPQEVMRFMIRVNKRNWSDRQ